MFPTFTWDSEDVINMDIAVLAQVPQNAEELLSGIVGIFTKEAAL